MMLSSMSVQGLCLSVLGVLFIYTLWLMRSGRLNAHVTVRWILIELACACAILIWRSLPVFGYTSSLGDRELIMILTVAFFALIAFLMLDLLVRISTHSRQIKLLTQELALLRQRSEPASATADAAPVPSSPAHIPKECKNPSRTHYVIIVWIAIIVYLYIAQDYAAPGGMLGAWLQEFFASMTAEYLH